MKTKRLHTIAFRFMLAFLAIVLPILAGISINYILGRNSIIESNQNIMAIRQDNIKTAFEQEMANIDDFQSDYAVSSDMEYYIDIYSILSVEERYSMMRDLIDELELLKRNNDWLYDIQVYIPSLDLMLSANAAKSELQDDELMDLLSALNQQTTFLMIDGKMCIASTDITQSRTIKYSVVCVVDPDKIEDFLSSYYTPEEEVFLLAQQEHTLLETSSTLLNYTKCEELLQYASTIDDNEIHTVQLSGGSYYVQQQLLYMGEYQIISVMSEEKILSDISDFSFIFAITIMVSLAMLIIYGYIFHKRINRPIRMLLTEFETAQKDNFNLTSTRQVPIRQLEEDEFKQLFEGFDQMLDELQTNVKENYSQKLLLQQMKLSQLQAQIDPHFLHNCFLNIYSLAEIEDYEEVQNFTKCLSRYYQYIMRIHQDVVTLKVEYHFLSLYMEIQNLRFGNRIHTSMQPLPPELEEIIIPRFVLQPLVENAYKYGKFTRQNKGVINVSVVQGDRFIKVLVEDSGSGFDSNKIEAINQIMTAKTFPLNSTGIYNVQKRIELFYGNESRLELFQSSLGGLGVCVLIQREGENHA